MKPQERNVSLAGVIRTGVLGLILSCAVTSQTRPVDVHRPLPDGITAQMISQGNALFHGSGRCVNCHGKNGSGSFLAPALNDAKRLNLQTASYDEIISLIRAGVQKPKRHLVSMPPFGGANLSDEELRGVAAYVFTLDCGP